MVQRIYWVFQMVRALSICIFISYPNSRTIKTYHCIEYSRSHENGWKYPTLSGDSSASSQKKHLHK